MPIKTMGNNQGDVEAIFSSSSGLLDAFGRLRVSNPHTIFDSKQLYDSLPLFYDDQETVGSGTSSVHSINRASTLMSVSGSTTGTRVRQTFRRFNYQPAKSQLVFATFVLGNGGSGITKRVGYFDENNGVFLEQEDGVAYFVVRSKVSGSVVDSRTPISSGNVNSDFASTLDFDNSQILFVDFEWLGVGTVAFGFVVDRVLHYIHFQNHANTLPSVYMSTPNLPVRYELSNDGTGNADYLEQICSSVISEGGVQETGTTTGESRGTSAINVSTVGLWYPIISIRLKSTHLGLTVQPSNLSATGDNTAIIYEVALIANPVVAGTDQAVWVGKTNSGVEYDITRDGTNTLTGGFIVGVETLSQSKGGTGTTIDVNNILSIGSTINGTRDELVLAVRRLNANATDFYGSLNWRELL